MVVFFSWCEDGKKTRWVEVQAVPMSREELGKLLDSTHMMSPYEVTHVPSKGWRRRLPQYEKTHSSGRV